MRILSLVCLIVLATVIPVTAGTDPSVNPYTPILLPIYVFDVPGAYGTSWSTAASWYYNPLDRNVSIVPTVMSNYSLTPGTGPLLAPVGTAGSPGTFVGVERDAADEIQFELRLRNTASTDWGTKIPVVRERDFAERRVVMGVPVVGPFRSALRIYGLPFQRDGVLQMEESVEVRIYDMGQGNLLARRELRLSGRYVPYAHALSLTDDFPEIVPRRTSDTTPPVSVEIRSLGEMKIWGFVTVTSNTTQHVSVISPE
jgi:hypothetical protein